MSKSESPPILSDLSFSFASCGGRTYRKNYECPCSELFILPISVDNLEMEWYLCYLYYWWYITVQLSACTLQITGRICWDSPPKMTGIPPYHSQVKIFEEPAKFGQQHQTHAGWSWAFRPLGLRFCRSSYRRSGLQS
jgi:hypothetical protein